MQFGASVNGYAYKLDSDENYCYFDIDKFFDKFIDFVESQGMYFSGTITRVDLSLDNEKGSDDD